MEKAKPPCPRGLGAGLEMAAPYWASEEVNREMDGTRGWGENGRGSQQMQGGEE